MFSIPGLGNLIGGLNAIATSARDLLVTALGYVYEIGVTALFTVIG